MPLCYHASFWAGFLFAAMGEWIQALPLLEKSTFSSRKMYQPWYEAVAHTLLGMALRKRGEDVQAYRHLRLAMGGLGKVDDDD